MQYTQEQREDIKSRGQEVASFLKEKEMELGAQINKVNVGENLFVDQLVPVLKDTKYAPEPEPVEVISPLSEEIVNGTEPTEEPKTE